MTSVGQPKKLADMRRNGTQGRSPCDFVAGGGAGSMGQCYFYEVGATEQQTMKKGFEGADSNAPVGSRLDLIGMAMIWIVALIMTNPTGNFPLNDDWSFALTVQQLLEQGRFEPHRWAAMPLVSNVILGWIFCAPFGSPLSCCVYRLWLFHWSAYVTSIRGFAA